MPEDAFQEQEPDEDEGQGAEDGFEVLHENRDALLVFLAAETQWRREIPAMADKEIWRGLRYTEVQAIIAMSGLAKQQRTIFEGIVDMERAALPILNNG